MIDIELRLYGDLRQYLDVELGTGYNLEVEDGSSIRAVVISLGIPTDAPKIIFVNGRHKELDDALFENDRLAIFPPVAGG
ncbi:MoaD/ThiS family protein [Candidatus Bathyarchaeota archaeon]|jgi:molybdopterin converting factor small subunit|nr:MAG: MoaD/ThiS family protein [Candidatus Bathyarchaeota archaeon]